MPWGKLLLTYTVHKQSKHTQLANTALYRLPGQRVLRPSCLAPISEHHALCCRAAHTRGQQPQATRLVPPPVPACPPRSPSQRQSAA
jgi:hypothetical protein